MLKPAVFLDRDSTLNQRVCDERQRAPVSPLQVERVSLRRDAVAFVRGLNRLGYLCLVITEQPELATGRLTAVRLARIHQELREALARNDAHLDGIFYKGSDRGGASLGDGPDQRPRAGGDQAARPRAGAVQAGWVQPARAQTESRDRVEPPAPSLLIEAASVHHVDLRRSFVVSDRHADMASGRAAGVETILLQRSTDRQRKHPEKVELRPDHIAENLLAALRIIESSREALLR